jgi:hypothetical protein
MGYIGKIAAVVTANTSDLSRKLSGAKSDVERFAKSVYSTVRSANSRAGKSFDEIYTPLQKMERAFRAVQFGSLGLDKSKFDIGKMQALVSASEQLAKPLGAATKGFGSLSAEIQGNFINALVSAQKASASVRDDINRTGSVGEARFEAVRRKVEATTAAMSRLGEAGRLAGGLATGRELRFQQPGFVSETQRAAALQQQAAAMSPEQIAGSGVAALVGRQRQAADEAANLLATLERVRLSRNGDAQAAQAAYDRQVAGLRAVNGELEREITLAQQAAAAEQKRIQALNSFGAVEADRRSGASARRNAAAFDAATAGVMAGSATSGREFGPVVRTMESELARARALQDQFRALPAGTQRQLEEQKSRFDVVANGASENAASLGTLADANDRFEASLRRSNDQLQRQTAAMEAARESAQSDRQRRAEVASSFLPPVLGRESDLLSNEGRSSLLPSSPRNVVLGGLRNEIDSVRNSVRELPDLAAAIGPEVDRLIINWNAMSRQGIQPAIADVRTLETTVRGLQAVLDSRRTTAQNFLSGFGGAGAAGLSLGIDERQLRGIGGEIEFVQSRLVGLSRTARGPLVDALEQYRQVQAMAFRGQFSSAEAAADAIAQARAEVVRLGAALLNISPRALERQLTAAASAARRVGDVSRGAFGNAGIAIQQAVFAIDDFFSVTGGMDQRIRAAGNNISQLGFLLGGTWGLIAGVVTSVVAQAVVGLMKMASAGVTAAHEAESLNEVLARQKSLAGDLAKAFASLSDSMVGRGFSGVSAEIRNTQKALEQIAKTQREMRVARAGSLNPEAVDRGAEIAALDERIKNTTTPGQRAALLAERDRLAAAQRRAAEEAAVRPPNFQDAIDAVGGGSVGRAEERRSGTAWWADLASPFLNPLGAANLFMDTRSALGGVTPQGEARRRLEAAGNNRNDQVAAIERRMGEIAPVAQQDLGVVSGIRGDSVGIVALEQEFRRLTVVLESLKGAAKSDEALIDLLKTLDKATTKISAAQARIAEGMGLGVPGAQSLAIELTRLSRTLDEAKARVDEANAAFEKSDGGDAARQNRDAAVSSATGQIRAAQQAIDAASEQAVAINAATSALQRFTEVLDRARQEAQQNLQQAQSRADQARRNDLGRSTPGTRTARSIAESQLEEQQAGRAEVEKQIALARNRFSQQTATFGQADARLREAQRRKALADTAYKASDEIRDIAQKVGGFDAAGLQTEEIAKRLRDKGRGEAADRVLALGATQSSVRDQLGLNNNNFWDGLEAANKEYEEAVKHAASVIESAGASTAAAMQRTAEIDAQLAAVGVLTEEQRQSLLEERAKIESGVIEQDAAVAKARDESTRAAEMADSAMRGRELAMTPRERAAEDAGGKAADIRRYFEARREHLGLVDPRAQQEAMNRLFEDQAKSVAPAIVGFREERMNAALQGPSRAALNVADTGTMEGQRELNRLLRGDDPAKDVNLQELKHQSELLQGVIEAIKNEGGGVLEMRG